jgi:hypothetical protein
MALDLQRQWPLLAAGVLVVVAIVLAMRSGQSQGYQILPGTDNSAATAQEAGAIAAANAQSQNIYAQTLGSLYGELAQAYGVTGANYAAFLQYLENDRNSRAAVQIANIQNQAQVIAARAYANASTWNTIFSGLGTLGGLFTSLHAPQAPAPPPVVAPTGAIA